MAKEKTLFTRVSTAASEAVDRWCAEVNMERVRLGRDPITRSELLRRLAAWGVRSKKTIEEVMVTDVTDVVV